MEIDPEGMRKIEEHVAAETSMRFQQALDVIKPDLLGCDDPDRVTDALVHELRPRGIYVDTDEQRQELHVKFAEPVAQGEAVRTTPDP